MTPEEVVQMHLVAAASKLSKTLITYLDRESLMDKLTNLDKYFDAATANEEGSEAKNIMRILTTMSSKKSMQKLF